MCKGIFLSCLLTFLFKDTVISCTPLTSNWEGGALQQGLHCQKLKLTPQKFHLNIGKHFLTMRVAKHWNKLPKHIVKSPSVEVLKTQLNIVLGNLLQQALLEQWDQTRWSQEIPSKPNCCIIHSSPQGSALLKLRVMQQFSQEVLEYRKPLQ